MSGNRGALRPRSVRVTSSVREHWPLYTITLVVLALVWWAFS